MLFEIARPGESCLTHITLEWLFPCVGELMLFEVARLGESCHTCVTLEWLFSCVGELTPFEDGRPGESCLVGMNVSFQSTWTGKFIPTLLALEMQLFLYVERERNVQWTTNLVSAL